jgi:hypothetical protein
MKSLVWIFGTTAFAVGAIAISDFALQAGMPEECTNICTPFGGAKTYIGSTHEWVVRCSDGAFFNEDAPSKCDAHGGLDRRTDLGSRSLNCFCKDGSIMDGRATPVEHFLSGKAKR